MCMPLCAVHCGISSRAKWSNCFTGIPSAAAASSQTRLALISSYDSAVFGVDTSIGFLGRHLVYTVHLSQNRNLTSG